MSQLTPLLASMNRPAWEPLLDGELGAKARAAAEAIAAAVHARTMTRQRASSTNLVQGSMGEALLLGYTDQERYHQSAIDLLEEGLSSDLVASNDHSLYFGRSGISWTAYHLAQRLGFAYTDECIETLADAIERSERRLPFDIVDGLVGIGCLAMEAACVAPPTRLISAITQAIIRSSDTDGHGRRWWTVEQSQVAAPGGEAAYINLGLPQGIIGPLWWLALHKDASDAGRAAYDSVLRFVIGEEHNDAGLRFGMVAGTVLHPAERPLAWCYGDVGICGALCAIPHLTPEADALLDRLLSSIRTMPTHPRIDATLCHGAAGIAHVLNRVWQRTRDEAIRLKAISWYEQVLRHRVTDDVESIAGFLGYRKKEWHASTGFLRGAAGIGLALFAASTTVPPAWDAVLMLSVPYGPAGSGNRYR